ncbi:hypothetical protein RhiirA5_498784 [Rhizophagus irregularis]|uniref:Transmembrane protein n=1 Tax=Rhizophagus irregularis TaxID=588596 RepID=A0A2N0PT74_9GLOM|nr:hypothetical protein RhiirA5_498784 [Rhizophagus irregularis]
MDSLLFFDGDRRKFRIAESLEQLIKLHPTIMEDPVVNDFLSGRYRSNLKEPSTLFITNLNEVVICLEKGAKNVSNIVLYTLRMIFKMDCYKVNGLPVILFWPNMQSEGRLMAKRLNNLLECKRRSKLSYPLSLAFFSLSWAFVSLKNFYIQFKRSDSSDDQRQDEKRSDSRDNQRQDEDERIPLNGDQKQKLKDHYELLQTILEEICDNLSDIRDNFHDNTIHDKFKDNFNILQERLKEFTQFMNLISNDLEAKLQKFQKERKNRSIKTGVSAAITVIAFGLAYFNPVASAAGKAAKTAVYFKGAACGAGVATGGYALYNGIKIYKLNGIIKEHKQVQKVIDDTQKFLKEICDSKDIIFKPSALEDQSQPSIILHGFIGLRDDVRKERREFLTKLQ